MKALKILNFMYKEAIQHEIINPEDFTGQETLSSEGRAGYSIEK